VSLTVFVFLGSCSDHHRNNALMPTIHTHLLPGLLNETDLTGSTCVIIDILRASTTMIHALANGARAVVPCLNVEDALAAAQRFPAEQRLLGGERHGELIPGFDLDNSPFRYGPETVRGKTVIFTTTNGTRALWASRSAQQVLVGGFVNLSALVRRLKQSSETVHLVCAGTDGQLTAEDILFAGAVVRELQSPATSEQAWKSGNVQSDLARDYFVARDRTPESFRQAFFESLGAQNLIELGMTADIDRCLQRDLFECVPQWNGSTGKLTVAEAVKS